MNYLLPLLLSALSTNGVHGYLLASHKANRKWTISEHAVLHRKGFMLYVLGHLLGGAFFLLFAKLYYVDMLHRNWFLAIAVFTVVFEYIQAFLPAKGRTNKAHTIMALIMWGSFITFGLLSIIFLPVTVVRKLLASIFYAGLLGTLVYSYSDRQRLYRHQMVMVALFYIAMFVLVL